MAWQDVDPSEDVQLAAWIGDRLHGFALDVGSVVPSGFDAYARIFHPGLFQRLRLEDPEREVSWATVAAWNHKIVHPEMQFHSIGGPWQGIAQRAGPPVYEPRTGALSKRQSSALAWLLSRHTGTPDACWMCLWDGYGDLRPSQRNRVRLPHRDYLLFHGAVPRAAGWDQGPNIWWPDDRSWCVASEIDFPYTYVGGSADLIAEILRHPDLESLPAKLTDGITAMSDTINS
jgi:hypothetical protein